MNIQICKAVSERKLLHFYYDGGYRTVEPFCHGLSKRWNEVLSAYQVAGYSKSGETIDWKIFKVSEMENITIEDKSFSGSRPNYNPNDSNMKEIHCHV